MTTNSQELNHVHVNQSFYGASTWATNFNGSIDLLPFSRRLKNGAFFLNLAISRLHQSFFWTTFLVSPQVHSLARQRCWFIQFVLINGLKKPLHTVFRFVIPHNKNLQTCEKLPNIFFSRPCINLATDQDQHLNSIFLATREQEVGIHCHWAAPDLVTPAQRVPPTSRAVGQKLQILISVGSPEAQVFCL